MEIIDGYTHCGVSKYEPIERVAEVMSAAGVRRAVLVQHLGEFDNAYLGRIAAADPARVFFLLPEEPSYIRQWLRSRDKWAALVPVFFEQPAETHPWLRSLGSGPDETNCPVLADPSWTTSADYLGWTNQPSTFIIDRQGIVRFEYRESGGTFDRPQVDELLKMVDGLEQK